MRSIGAGLRRLVLPYGATGPRIVIGPDLPAELVTFYGGALTAAILFYTSATTYRYIGVFNIPGFADLAVEGMVDTAAVPAVVETSQMFYDATDGASLYLTPDYYDLTAGQVVIDSADDVIIDAADVLDIAAGTLILAQGDWLIANGDVTVQDNMTVGGLFGTRPTYTPTIDATGTDPTLGVGAVQSGQYYERGGLVHAFPLIRFGTSGTAAGTGDYRITCPTAISADLTASGTLGLGSIIGHGMIRDNSSATTGSRPVQAQVSSLNGGPGGVGLVDLYCVDGTTARVTATAPFAWSTSDAITLQLAYPPA